MNPRRKIIWEYWQNPYGAEGPEFVDEEDADVPDPSDEQKQVSSKNVEVRPVIPTSMGLIPVTSFRTFTEVFEFWIGHTNFYITSQVEEAIEFSPGVEIFELFSPYRFRICIGKAFNGNEVKHAIQKELNALPPARGEINPNLIKLDEETQDKVSLLQYDLRDRFPYWAIYVMPNGEIDASGSNTEEGHEMHIRLYTTALDIAGGVIYKYA